MKEKKIGIICLVVAILAVGGYFGVRYFLDKDLEKEQDKLEQLEKDTVYLEKESVQTTIAKFNTEIMDNGMEYPVSDDYLTEENGVYFYGVYEDIGFYAVPVSYTGDTNVDITKDTAVFCEIGSKNEEKAMEYVRRLIKANNPNLSDSEIVSLMEKSEELAKDETAVDENNGLFISYDEVDGNRYYIVTRNMKN